MLIRYSRRRNGMMTFYPPSNYSALRKYGVDGDSAKFRGVLVLQPARTVKNYAGWLHEMGHAVQYAIGNRRYAFEPRSHVQAHEADAWGMALQWVAPDKLGEAMDYALYCLSTYCYGDYGQAAALLSNALETWKERWTPTFYRCETCGFMVPKHGRDAHNEIWGCS